MRPRTLLTTFVVVSAGTALTLAIACSQGSGPAQDPSGSDGAATSQSPANGGTAAASADTAPPASSGGAATASGGMPGAECRDVPPAAEADVPDGGVAMSNAMTASDAGSSDRLVPIMDIVAKNRPKFACCFDLWGRKNVGKEVKVTLTIKLKESGELESATYKPDETDITDKDVEACMQNVAKSLTFPESPSGKVTRYNQRFNFRGRAK
ncbi:MAG TPA: AgmX/PglI C-terminal domain-containing protein [Polyangiaceae bacterium]|nr:AgmX/PglI C-terminal domain-containing protein [Polyangiaceae bacterium]